MVSMSMVLMVSMSMVSMVSMSMVSIVRATSDAFSHPPPYFARKFIMFVIIVRMNLNIMRYNNGAH